MAFRVNTARARVIMVGLPSVAAAALFADGLKRLRELMPQHSFAFFLSAHALELDKLPSVLRERYAVLTWADSATRTRRAAFVMAAQPAAPEQTVLRMIQASQLRTGGVLSLGVSPGQRLAKIATHPDHLGERLLEFRNKIAGVEAQCRRRGCPGSKARCARRPHAVMDTIHISCAQLSLGPSRHCGEAAREARA